MKDAMESDRLLDCSGQCREGRPVTTTEHPQPAVPRLHRYVGTRKVMIASVPVFEEIWACWVCDTSRRYGLRG